MNQSHPHSCFMVPLQATEEIRARPGPNQRTPIVAVTANAMKGDREKVIQHSTHEAESNACAFCWVWKDFADKFVCHDEELMVGWS
jgi:CheY-like chemotaxis protein